VLLCLVDQQWARVDTPAVQPLTNTTSTVCAAH